MRYSCNKGEGTLKINGTVYTIKRESFFFLMANVPHEYYGNTDKWEFEWIA